MTQIPPLTSADIRKWVGERNFEIGQTYFLQGSILNSRRFETILKADCIGTQGGLYRVETSLGPQGIRSARCSCPVGAGGSCKHVAALLLTWLDEPESFVPGTLPETGAEPLSEPVLPPGQTDRQEFEPETIRALVNQAFQGGPDAWEDPRDLVRKLQPALDYGDRLFAAGACSRAAGIFRTLAQSVLAYELALMKDEEGYLHGLVWHCADRLGRCLSGTGDPDQRQEILGAMFDIYAWDVNSGGVGLADLVPDIFREQATRTERQLLAHWIESRLPEGSAWHEQYVRQVWETLLQDLAAE